MWWLALTLPLVLFGCVSTKRDPCASLKKRVRELETLVLDLRTQQGLAEATPDNCDCELLRNGED